MTMNEPLVEVNRLGKVVPLGSDGAQKLTILHEISFSVAHGECVAIVGASGSGKSTLLGLMAGLDRPTSGSVLLAGQDIGALDEDDRAVLRAQLLGFVFQSFHLLPALSALENVMLPLELAGQLSARAARTSAGVMLARVGLGDRLAHYPRQLSGGEQQRVALARAFAAGPRLLLADEPTGNLDAATGGRIIDLMFAMNAEAGTTLILVTHDDRLAARCTRTLRMAAGRLQEN